MYYFDDTLAKRITGVEITSQREFKATFKWDDLDSMPIMFTNQMLIQHVQNEFVLSFGYMTPPPFLKPPTVDELQAIDHVPVRPIIRLGMTPDRLLELIKLLQANYRGYQEKISKKAQM